MGGGWSRENTLCTMQVLWDGCNAYTSLWGRQGPEQSPCLRSECTTLVRQGGCLCGKNNKGFGVPIWGVVVVSYLAWPNVFACLLVLCCAVLCCALCRYFGAAKSLPGVKELFQEEAPKVVRGGEGALMRQWDVMGGAQY